MNYTRHFECGCEIHAVLEEKIIIGSDIHQCPLHKFAPDLYEALKRFLESSACQNDCDPNDMTCDTSFARKALAKAEK